MQLFTDEFLSGILKKKKQKILSALEKSWSHDHLVLKSTQYNWNHIKICYLLRLKE